MTNINAHDAEGLMSDAERLRRHGLFADVPDKLLNDLAAGAFDEQRETGDYFFREGDPAPRYLLVTQGRVDMVRVGIDGQERVAKFFETGGLLAEAAMFMAHGRYPMSARASGRAAALCL
ncbi:MAG: cyclic nucleotide-binding domain-containing protein, partial [Caldimonas sp.]